MISKFEMILLSFIKKGLKRKTANITDITQLKELSQNSIPFDKKQTLLSAKKEDTSKIKLYPSFRTQEAVHRYYYKNDNNPNEIINLKV
jgi:histidinol-phosphate/aromatic aminotransferase/cobyric acid decarboxylase-like protein